MRAEMKSFAERNRLAIGTVGIVVVAAVALAALQYQRLPFFNQGTRVSAYFADAGGLRTGNTVEVSGYPVGKVSSISLDGPGVLVEFKVDTDVRLGNRTEVAIKTKGLLGSKFLDVTPRGDGRLDSPIPIERTTSPYQLPDALGDLAATISGLHTERLSESLATLAQTFADTPAHFRNAIHGVARLAQTLDERDNQLRSLLANAAKEHRGAGQPHRPDRRPGARHECGLGAAAHPKRRPGPDLGEHLGGGRTTAGLHR